MQRNKYHSLLIPRAKNAQTDAVILPFVIALIIFSITLVRQGNVIEVQTTNEKAFRVGMIDWGKGGETNEQWWTEKSWFGRDDEGVTMWNYIDAVFEHVVQMQKELGARVTTACLQMNRQNMDDNYVLPPGAEIGTAIFELYLQLQEFLKYSVFQGLVDVWQRWNCTERKIENFSRFEILVDLIKF